MGRYRPPLPSQIRRLRRRSHRRSHPGGESLDVRPLRVAGHGHEIEAVTREREGVCFDQRSTVEFAADHYVAADSDALTRADRINRMQLFPKAYVPPFICVQNIRID